jgi:hypothetical protein
MGNISELAIQLFDISWTDNTNGLEYISQTEIKTLLVSELPQMWLPESVCHSFEAAFGLVWDSASTLYLINETLHTSLLSRNITVKFTVGDAANKVTFDFPYSMFDLTIGPSLVKNKSWYFPLRRVQSLGQYSLGRVFMQRAYITADYDRHTFNISRAVYNNETDNRIFAISPPSAKEQKGVLGKDEQPRKNILSSATIAGISIAISAFLIALGFFIFRYFKRKSAEDSTTREHKSSSSPDIGPGKAEMEGEGIPRVELNASENERKELESAVAPVELDNTEICASELPAYVPMYEVKEGRKLSP